MDPERHLHRVSRLKDPLGGERRRSTLVRHGEGLASHRDRKGNEWGREGGKWLVLAMSHPKRGIEVREHDSQGNREGVETYDLLGTYRVSSVEGVGQDCEIRRPPGSFRQGRGEVSLTSLAQDVG